MSTQIGELVVDMRADVARMRQDLAEGKRALQLTTQDMLNQMKNIEGVLSRVNWAAGIHLLEKGVQYATQAFGALKRSAIDSADQMNKLSQATGWAVESLSAIKYAAELSDVSIEGMAKSLKQMAVNMYDAQRGSKEAVDLFAAMKIPMGDTEAALLAVADRFQAMPDGALKSAYAVKLFGKEGMAMIPFLNQGKDGIAQLTDEARRFGLVISGETARQAEEFNDNLTRLQRNFDGIVQQLGVAMMPVLVSFTEKMLEAKTETGGLDEQVRNLAGNRRAMEEFLESTATGLAHLAEVAVSVKRVLVQPFESFEAVGVDVQTWIKKDALRSAKSMGADPAKIDAAINDLEHARRHYMASTNMAWSGTSPGYVDNVRQFFADHRARIAQQPAPTRTPDGGLSGTLPTVTVKAKAPTYADVFTGQEFSKSQRARYGNLGGFSFITGDKDVTSFIRQQYQDTLALEGELIAEREKAMAAETEWARQETEHFAKTWSELIAQRQEYVAAALDLDNDVAVRLGQLTGDAFMDGYGRRFDAVQKQLQQDIQRFEAARQGLSQEQADQLLFGINAAAGAGYNKAAFEGANEQLAQADAARRQRLATLQAQVTTGIKTQSDAYRENISISADALTQMEAHTDVLQGLADNGYLPAQRALEQYRATLIELRDAAREKTWVDGLQRGLDDYAGAVTDKMTMMRNAVGTAFKGMEDALTDFVMTGKLDFKSLTNSIIADMVRMQIQANITKPLAGLASSFIGSFFGTQTAAPIVDHSFAAHHTGGIVGIESPLARMVNPGVFTGAPRFHSGGLVGGEVPIIAQRGEGVFTREQMRALAPAGGNVQVNVINNANGTQASARERTDSNGNRIIDVLIEQVKGAIAGDISRGAGPIPAALGSTYGLNRVAGAY